MKYYVLLIFIFTSASSYAQQNFFNVPSSEITTKKKWFFQQQMNFVKGLASSTTLNYGIGNKAEIGINYNGLYLKNYQAFIFNSDTLPYSPFFCINGQKKIQVTQLYSISVGSQFGISTTKEKKFGMYSYINSAYHSKNNNFKTVLGVYYATDSYFGAGSRNYLKTPIINQMGVQWGIEQRLSKRFVFQTDLITGEHSLSELVIGTAYYVNKNWVISSGLQLPMFNNVVNPGLIIELTFVPSD